MQLKAYRGYGALRVGRRSFQNSDYFLTGCLERPHSGLCDPLVAEAVRGQLFELERSGPWHLRTFVIMADHFHLLATLTAETQISGLVRTIKGPLTPVLRLRGLRWQQSFYDHRLRSSDEVLPTFRYIYLNPYRAGLIEIGQRWPWYYCCPEDAEWFEPLTDDGLPFPEWLR
jgi:REP element-mobilizing transposase RayT